MVNKHVVLNLENVLLTLNYFAKIGTVNFRLGVGSSTRSYNEILLLEENHLADWSAESHYYHKILCRAGEGRVGTEQEKLENKENKSEKLIIIT